MRNFLVIIFIAALVFGGIFYIAKSKSSPQTSIDGSTDVGQENSQLLGAAVDVDTLVGDARNSKGDSLAKVTIVEFSDFQCPYCKIASEEINTILPQYKDVRFVFRQFPLSSHPLAQKAAEAAEAAGAQNKDKFWEMHDKIFSNQSSLTEDSFEKFATELGLNVNQFKQDLSSGKYKDLTTKDYQDGIKVGVQGTPSFYINGKKINLTSFNDLKTAIDKELAGNN